MINPALVELLQGAAGADRVLGYEEHHAFPWWLRATRLAARLRQERVDLVLISNSTKEFHVAAWLAGIPVRVGYDRKWGFLLTHRLEDRRLLGECHEVEYNMRLLAALGLDVPTRVILRLPITKEGDQSCLQLFEKLGVSTGHRLVVVHPWSSNRAKQWPLDHVRMLLERLSRVPGACVIVVGGREETSYAATLMRGIETVVNAVGRLSLSALAACLQRARVVITTDSGPMHLAAAVQAPVVALFGTADPGSHPRRWGPWGQGHTVIHKPLEQITVEEVLAAAQQYLGAWRPSAS